MSGSAEQVTVLVTGEGPAVEAVDAMLEDVSVTVRRGGIETIQEVGLAIVVGLAGSEGFHEIDDQAAEAGTPWIAVEVGGIGGVPVEGLSAAVSTFQPGYVCYDGLTTRVKAAGIEPAEEANADRAQVRLAGSYAGIQAIRALSGAEVAGVVIEVPYAERSLLPVPKCAHAQQHVPALALESTSATLESALERAELAVDDRLGLVPWVGEQESFPLPYYLAAIADTTGASDGQAPDRAAGVARTWDGAFMKALGEALERYSAAIYRLDELRNEPTDSIDGPALDRFVSVDSSGLPASVPVVDGRDLLAGGAVSLPADLVYYPQPAGELGQAITTGLGLGSDGVEAVLSGLYEVLERDATMLAWYSTFEPLGLEVREEAFRTMVRRARGEDLTVRPLLLTQDVDVPVVAVAVRGESYPRLALGSAADLDAEAAAQDALAEALQNWIELRDMGPEKAREAGGAIGRYAEDPPGSVESMLDVEETVPAGSVGPEPVPDGRAELDAVLDRVEAAGLGVYAAPVTPRDVEGLGFTAVRVLSPTAQPLFVEEPVFGERAETVPRDLGFEPRPDREFHPFP